MAGSNRIDTARQAPAESRVPVLLPALPALPSEFAIRTEKGFYLTAIGGGGRTTDVLHTDATQLRDWERFRFVKCGDPGTGHEYGIMAADGSFLTARGAGGLTNGAISKGYPSEPDARFTLLRQDDGSYAFRTANGVNFLTALQGGGLVQKYVPPDCGWRGACIGGFTDIFHTDATQIRGWEKFKVIDRGDCTYEIQTTSGFDMGIFQSPQVYWLLTTRQDGVSSANETFQLVAYGLESEPILH